MWAKPSKRSNEAHSLRKKAAVDASSDEGHKDKASSDQGTAEGEFAPHDDSPLVPRRGVTVIEPRRLLTTPQVGNTAITTATGIPAMTENSYKDAGG